MCLTPIALKKGKDSNSDYATVTVPCGKCPKCRLRRIQSWVFRLTQEDRRHSSAVFCTLTYAPENIRITNNGFMTLEKRDLQLFMKRLRKNTGRNTIRYYNCGEYGGRTFRPHYHGIIFDATQDEIIQAWQLGDTHFGDVNNNSIAYVTKYICKPARIPLHEMDDRVPEFSLMSKKMGSNYLTPAVVQHHHDKEKTHLILPDGYVQVLPRYYRDKIFTKEDLERINRPAARLHAEKFDKAVEKAGSLTEFYRIQYETIRAQTKLFNKQSNRNTI